MAAVNLASLKSPGVYVKEVGSGIKAITGVSTSTAGFIGIFIPNGWITSSKVENFDGNGNKEFDLNNYPVVTDNGSYQVLVDGEDKTSDVNLTNDDQNGKATLKFKDSVTAPADKQTIEVRYDYEISVQVEEDFGKGDDNTRNFTLKRSPLSKEEIVPGKISVSVGGAPIDAANTITIAGITETGKVSIELKYAPAKDKSITVTYSYRLPAPPNNQPVLCTNFGEFKSAFFDSSVAEDKRNLAHAVSGFFTNGGSRCYVICGPDIKSALGELAKIDEISMVAAPGKTDAATQQALIDHCQLQDGIFYRVAILDGVDSSDTSKIVNAGINSNYAALYYPWIKVADPKNPKNTLDVPPSGAIAGIYARVDNDRGVHKAPANEPVRGALGITQPLSKPDQDGLNPGGINCIRLLNNNITVWGARTLGGDANQDLKYINVRRTLLFLRKSIDQSTQWVVFEPNTPALWQQITRNVSAFLTTVWRSGALFGNTPEEAFYVKCDAETNPFDVRENGAVVTEIGVAIARPAEFVVFQISQWAGPGQ